MMADYITADKWLTGVATHKTKHGRILCTGFGCVGCFPEDYPEIARELEVFDNKTALLFGQTWSDLSYDEAIETASDRRRLKRTARKRYIGKRNKRASECEGVVPNDEKGFDHVTNGEVNAEDNDEVGKLFLTELSEHIHEIGQTQTECKENILGRNANKSWDENDLSPVESHKEPSEYSNGASKLQDMMFDSDKCLSSISLNNGIVEREDCVCLFFALEFNRSARVLPDFSIVEIVSSLNALMHINEIKCVQRMDGMWRIVLRTRRNLGHLLTYGLIIRGRWYAMTQDNNAYCDKVY